MGVAPRVLYSNYAYSSLLTINCLRKLYTTRLMFSSRWFRSAHPSSYDLSSRTQDRLIRLNKTSYLNDRDFVIRMPACACATCRPYWLLYVHELCLNFSFYPVSVFTLHFCQKLRLSVFFKEYKKAQLMLAYPRDAKTMKKIPPFRSYNKFQSTRKSGVYSRPN